MADETCQFQTFDDLTALDWDDSELVAAYVQGMELKHAKLRKAKGGRNSYKKESGKKWKIGDYCRAIYYSDNLEYEAKIVKISDDYCTIVFLGYDEEVDVELNSLTDSLGKSARKKQIKKATIFLYAEDSASVDGVTSDSQQTPKYKKRTSANGPQETIPDHSLYNYTAADTTFHGHVAPHCSGMSGNPNLIPPPPPPPIPQCQDLAKNPSLCAMLTSWYMAGYYTGLHQGQKGMQCHQQRCCGHSNQFGCHH